MKFGLVLRQDSKLCEMAIDIFLVYIYIHVSGIHM